jgi:hypothetical protein
VREQRVNLFGEARHDDDDYRAGRLLRLRVVAGW